MGKKIFLVGVVCLLAAACGSPGSDPTTPTVPVVLHANVVMTEGPKFVDGDYIFEFKGTVKNIGNRQADFAKVYIYLRDSAGNLIDQDYSYADDTELLVSESAPWNVMWWDDDHKIRDKISLSKTTYEILWDEF